MWGYIRQETREINGNIATHGPGYDDRLNRSETINVIEIFDSLEVLKTFLAKNFPGKDVKIFKLEEMVAYQKIDIQPLRPVTRSGGGTKI